MRCAEVSRRTGETDINISLDLDGQGTSNLDTGMGFFEHMLNLVEIYLWMATIVWRILVLH